jgi:hypothetical protein
MAPEGAPNAESTKGQVVELQARAWPLPAKLVLRPFAVSGALTLYFLNSLLGQEGGLAFALGMFVFFSLVLTPVLLGTLVLKSVRTRVALDDGGMRLALRGSRGHWSYSVLGSAELRLSSFGTDALVVSDRTGRTVVEVPALNAAARESAKIVAQLIHDGCSATRAWTRPPSEELARRGLSLAQWCRALDELAELPENPGFRDRALDRDELCELSSSSGAPIEQRAAASYVLLRSGGAHRLRALAELGPAAPPLLVALAQRAAAGELPISAAALAEAVAFLDEDDRREITAA